jgi:regulator of protease activity HflC (stomatin/prohibitin superfamily)
MSNSDEIPASAILFGIFFVLFCVVGGMIGCPMYGVYEQEKAGEAELKRADSNRRIAVLEAQAKMDSAKLLAQSEIERAKGVAEANKIIGEGLRNNEDYLRYLWITELHAPDKTVIYVPTEANMPILEASRLQSVTAPK